MAMCVWVREPARGKLVFDLSEKKDDLPDVYGRQRKADFSPRKHEEDRSLLSLG